MFENFDLEEKIRNVQQTEVVVLRDVNRFPVYNQDFLSPNLVLSICNRGTAKTLYDNQDAVFRKNNLAVVLPNHILCPLESSDDYSVTMLVLSSKFLDEMRLRTLSHDHHKFHLAPNSLLTEEQVSMLSKVIDIIDTIVTAPANVMPNKHEILVYQVNVLFELLNSFRYEQDKLRLNVSHSNKVFNDFCNLLAKNFRKSREVNYYAEKLHLTPRYFSRIIFESVGMTASDWIEQYITTYAKEILTTRRDLSIQQISYMLGFTEASAFCRFFKRATGLTPKDYRNLDR